MRRSNILARVEEQEQCDELAWALQQAIDTKAPVSVLDYDVDEDTYEVAYEVEGKVYKQWMSTELLRLCFDEEKMQVC